MPFLKINVVGATRWSPKPIYNKRLWSCGQGDQRVAPAKRYPLKQFHIIAQILIRLFFFRFIVK
jgi:hypothetical protein